jgi:hypothetical protein
MHSRVACVTQRDQIFLRIVARVAAEILVVHLEVGHRAARLASPAIAMQHLVAQLFVRHGLKPAHRRVGLTGNVNVSLLGHLRHHR